MWKSLIKKFCVFLLSTFTLHYLFVFAKVDPGNFATSFISSGNAATDTTLKSDTITEINFNAEAVTNKEVTSELADVKLIQADLYASLNLGKLGLSRQAFDYAMKGYSYFLSQNKLINQRILTIVDFSLPSSKKRLFVLDLKEGKVLFNTYVSHGRNSGKEQASSFSNDPESFKSSLGFYITKDTYSGKHGYSLRLDGQDRGFNDNALERAIVMHPAAYVDESLIKMQGYIGRSLGCPAIPESLHRPIIEKIKNGSCLFLYSPDKYYTTHSRILNRASV